MSQSLELWDEMRNNHDTISAMREEVQMMLDETRKNYDLTKEEKFLFERQSYLMHLLLQVIEDSIYLEGCKSTLSNGNNIDRAKYNKFISGLFL
jgi:hypothetical protein